MSALIIAEKPSVGKSIANWLSRTYGHPEVPVGRTHIAVGPYTVSWLFGHVLENAKPEDYDPAYKKWDLRALPIVPPSWRLQPKEDAAAQIKTLKSLLAGASEVIGLGDPDPEGQLLQDEFLLWAGCRAPVKRLWLPATDDATIAKAWAGMKPNAVYEGLYWAALARSHADWLYGINATRACTIAARNVGGNALYTVGRVQTPTLALVVKRELAIRTFKPTDYFTPTITLASTPQFKATWAPDKEDARLDAEGRLLNLAEAERIIKACVGKSATVTEATGTKGKENPPLPFSLSSLQEHLSRSAGMGVQDVLKYAQSLYEKKLTSYPRTDCDYLPESQHKEAATIFSGLRAEKMFDVPLSKADPSLKSGAFNDKKVTAHHAIVPRPCSVSDVAALTKQEYVVWREIAKRYLLQFFPAAEFKSTEIRLACEGEAFRATGKVYLNRGWRDAFVGADEDDGDATDALPPVKKGDSLAVTKSELVKTRTKPPKRYTEGTLVTAMKNVHRDVTDPRLKAVLRENIGIGTVATQANIIGELFNRKFIELDKKDIKPTPLGESLILALPTQLTAPDMTALWQQSMDDIKDKGRPGYDAFMAAQTTWLTTLVKDVPAWFATSAIVTVPGAAGSSKPGVVSKHACPACKGTLRELTGKHGEFFACNDCKATFNSVKGKPVKAAPKTGPAVTIGGVASGSTCTKCKTGVMRVMTCGPHTKTPGRQFLSCSGYNSTPKCAHTIWPEKT